MRKNRTLNSVEGEDNRLNRREKEEMVAMERRLGEIREEPMEICVNGGAGKGMEQLMKHFTVIVMDENKTLVRMTLDKFDPYLVADKFPTPYLILIPASPATTLLSSSTLYPVLSLTKDIYQLLTRGYPQSYLKRATMIPPIVKYFPKELASLILANV